MIRVKVGEVVDNVVEKPDETTPDALTLVELSVLNPVALVWMANPREPEAPPLAASKVRLDIFKL